jgi:signal transduction histidine kinase
LQIADRELRKDGSLVWAKLTVSLVRDDLDRPQFFIGLAEDFTRSKQAEDARVASQLALRESYERIEYLACRLITSQENERKYIARELHDDLNQRAVALAFGLGKLDRQLRNVDAQIRE